MGRFSTVPVVAAIITVGCLSLLVGCGGSSSSSGSTATQMILSPTSASLNQGDVLTLSATTENSSGNVVAADISFTSSNNSIATVSTGGLVCAGTWDANIINCNAKVGQSGVGKVTITATSGVATASMTIYVHEKVDRVDAVVQGTCSSMGQVIPVYGIAYSTSAPGCSTASPCNITSTVGPFTFGTNDSVVATPSNSGSGLLRAGQPGSTTIFASVSGVNSTSVPYLTCPVSYIYVHSATDSNTSFTMSSGGTQPLTADVYDTSSQYIKPNLTWASSSNATATVASTGSVNNPGTITAVAAGTASITASCSYPDCNKNLPAQYSINVVLANVSGGTSTTVYAASTNSTTLVPINAPANTTGTAITLPHVPNSIISDPAGTTLYLGSSSGLMVVNVSAGTVTTQSVAGTVIAISPDGTYLLISDSAADAIYYYNTSAPAITFTDPANTTTSSAYTPDSKFNEWVNGNVWGVGLQNALSSAIPLQLTLNAVDIMAQGGLSYLTSSAGHEIDVFSTCNQVEVQALPANNPTLIRAIPKGTGAVAVDSPDLDVITTPSTLSPGCPVTSQSVLNIYNLNAGSFNARQLFLSSDSTRAWIISDLPELLGFYIPGAVPYSIPYTGHVTAYSGGITLSGSHVYVGASDNTVHHIDVATSTDTQQISVNLKDSSGNVVAPNLVYVLP